MDIVLFDNFAENNLGDRLYPVCFMEKFKSYGGDFNFKLLDIHGKSVDLSELEKINSDADATQSKQQSMHLIRKIYRATYPLSREIVWYLITSPRLKKTYKKAIEGSSAIIIPGGGIIEATYLHYFYHHLDILTRIADKNKLPVYFNAVGVVVDPKHMFGWKTMKKVLNRECVKMITSRDGTDWLNKNMFDGREVAKTAACSAIFTDEIYNVSKQETKTIGIGVIRGNAFSAYGNNIDEEAMIDIYERVIRLLLEKGYKCEIYHNGGRWDEIVAQQLFNRFALGTVSKAERPDGVKDLINTISGYQGIITARLHSLYIAYSLKIPAVGLCYTHKHIDFMHLIGNDNCAITVQNLDSEYIVKVFEEELEHGYNEKTYHEVKQDAESAIRQIHDSIIQLSTD